MRQAAPENVEGVGSEALALLAEIGEEINASLDLDDVLSKAAALIKRAIDYDIFAVLLLDEATNELFFRFAIGHRKEVVENWRIPFGQGITGAAALTGRAIRVPDVRSDPRYIVPDVRLNPHYLNAVDTVRSELAVPLMLKGKCIGVLDIQSPQLDGFTREEQHLLTLLASRLAIAIENARLFERARRQTDMLLLLNEVGRQAGESLELEEVLRRAAELTKRVIDYQIFNILLYDERERVFRHSISVKFGQNVQERSVVREGEGIVGTAARSRKPVVLVNPETRSELAIPLISKSGVIGVLDLESPKVNYFTADHVQALSILAAHLAVSIENARLYQRVAGHEARLESELEAARIIQGAILPAVPKRSCGLEIATRYLPARELGGDLYDFSPYGPQQLGIVLGDASGKGVDAALYGAVTIGVFRSLAPRRLSPGAVLEEMDRLLSERQIEAHFTTFCFAVWHRGRRELRLANAGQCEPLLVRPGRVETLAVAGFPLGLGVARSGYKELRLRLVRGDTLILYSDGLTESENSSGELYGSERLREAAARLLARPDASPARVADGLLEAVARFTRGAPLGDDRTLVVLKVK